MARSSTPEQVTDKPRPVIEVGWLVAITLPEGTAPLRCYVGEVQAVDYHGIRITCLDWLVGMFSGSDVFVRWGNIDSALVYTDEHARELFGQDAARWQEAMNHPEQVAEP